MKASNIFLVGLTGPLFGAQGVNGFEFPDCVSGPLAKNTVCDTTASPSDRAAALVKALTTSEKLVNLVDNSKGAPRLGLPPYQWWNEALHGVAASPGVSFNRSGGPFSYATSFANAITLASAFDDDLVLKVGEAISTEARAFIHAGRAGLEFWTPNINPFKDPRWGRGAETPGEDPFRVKGYTAAIVAGLEGSHATIRKVIATCKHYAAYDLERWKGVVRYQFNAVVSMQDLTEYYLPPFQQCARDSKAGSIMCSYNAVNGTPACANTYLMNDILREHWGWTEHNNFITSDCNAIKDFLPDEHNYSSTPAEAAAAAYVSGTDTVCEVPGWPPFTDVVGAYNQTLLSEAVVDTALRRLYEGLIRAGYFDPPSSHPYGSLTWADVNTPEHQFLALQSATDGAVLLKNLNSTLPIDLTGKSVALIGHWAGWLAGSKMLGPYSGIPPFLVAPEVAALLYNVTYYPAPGPVTEPISNDTWTEVSLVAAKAADVIIYCGGTDMSIASEDKDREQIAWPASQLAQIDTLAALGKPLIVAQLGDQVDDSPLLSNTNVSAIVWMGYPGQAGGLALFDVLTGKTPPAARLPVTQYPAEYVDQVPLTEMALRPVEEKSPGRTYRWYDKAVLPFGYGLQYTTFDVAISTKNAARSLGAKTSTKSLLDGCTNKNPDLCVFISVPVEVTNTGKITSDHVVLLFLRGEFGPKPYPRKTLVGYTRLRGIQPGEKREVVIEVKLGEIARRNEKGDLLLYGGRYEFVVGIEDDQEGWEFELDGSEGEEVVLERFPQPK
ncbi:putative exo-1,4-beta-xylosidase bxlB [Naviculisporaceae sp. PSN 640]